MLSRRRQWSGDTLSTWVPFRCQDHPQRQWLGPTVHPRVPPRSAWVQVGLCSPQTQLCCSNVCVCQPRGCGSRALRHLRPCIPSSWPRVCRGSAHEQRGIRGRRLQDSAESCGWRGCARVASALVTGVRAAPFPRDAGRTASLGSALRIGCGALRVCSAARAPTPAWEERSCHPPRRATCASRQGQRPLPHSARAPGATPHPSAERSRRIRILSRCQHPFLMVLLRETGKVRQRTRDKPGKGKASQLCGSCSRTETQLPVCGPGRPRPQATAATAGGSSRPRGRRRRLSGSPCSRLGSASPTLSSFCDGLSV